MISIVKRNTETEQKGGAHYNPRMWEKKQRDDSSLEVSLVCIANFRAAWASESKPASEMSERAREWERDREGMDKEGREGDGKGKRGRARIKKREGKDK